MQANDSSFRLDSALAQINMAHVLELLGEEQAAREAFAAAIHAATNKSRQTRVDRQRILRREPFRTRRRRR